ncbi:MAG: HU family DNA-binding protein [Ruminococcus sp.]|nr:HU family DNA-binding protein [Ruminococcus sp.]
MTKAELVAAIAEKGGYNTKKDAEKALAAVIDSITDALVNGDKVSLVGFGTFEVRHRAAKDAINPATKKPVHVDAKDVPAFKAGKALKDAVNK